MLALAFICCALFSMLIGVGVGVLAKPEPPPPSLPDKTTLFDPTVQALLDTIEQHPELWEPAPSQRPEDTGYSLRSTKLSAALHATISNRAYRVAHVAEGTRIIFALSTFSSHADDVDFQRWSAIHGILAKHASRGFADKVLKAVGGVE